MANSDSDEEGNEDEIEEPEEDDEASDQQSEDPAKEEEGEEVEGSGDENDAPGLLHRVRVRARVFVCICGWVVHWQCPKFKLLLMLQ